MVLQDLARHVRGDRDFAVYSVGEAYLVCLEREGSIDEDVRDDIQEVGKRVRSAVPAPCPTKSRVRKR